MSRAALAHDMMLRQPASSEDHVWLVELHNDPLVLNNLTDPSPITLETHFDWWAGLRNRPSERRYIFEIDGRRVGFTKFYSIDHVNKSCVLGADIHKDYRGKGLAKPMWTMMLDKAFNEWQLHRVGLTTAEYNHVAQKVYRGLGFMVEGRLTRSLYRDGKFYDQVMMYMLKSDWEGGTP